MRSAVDAALLALVGGHEPMARPALDADGWTALVREAVRHGVASLVHARLQAVGSRWPVPDTVRQSLKACQLRTGMENLRLLTRLAEVLRQWQANGIGAIVLKGAYLAQSVYAEASLRSMGDADLLLRRADLARASALLRAGGWLEGEATEWTSPAGGGHQLPVFRSGTACLELHWAIEDDDSPFAIDGEGLWQRAVATRVGGAPALALAPEDLLLHLALHTAYGHGWLQFDNGLRPLVDIAACLRHFEHRLDWDALVERARAWRVHACVWLALMLVRELLRVGAPQAALDRLAPPHADRALVDAASELVLGRHYQDLRARLPVLGRGWLTKHWHRLPRSAHWRAHALPGADTLHKAYPRLHPAPLQPLRYAAHWAELLHELARVSFGREARALVARERRRVRLLRWLEAGSGLEFEVQTQDLTPFALERRRSSTDSGESHSTVFR